MIYWKQGGVTILHDDVLKTREIPSGSIDLIVTSPPYNLDMDYGSRGDDMPYDQYMAFNEKWLSRCHNWLKDDGRFCLNVPLDKNKGGLRSVGADFTVIAKKVGFSYRSTIVWNEGNISRRTAWGSWLSASAPYVIAPVELILVFCKKRWKKRSGSRESTIAKDEFIAWTNGLWTFSGESSKKIGHPAPFPVELPKRCIKLFSYVDDIVLDPFVGSGTTLVAAAQLRRQAIGVDIDETYCALAKQRVLAECSRELWPASGSGVSTTSGHLLHE